MPPLKGVLTQQEERYIRDVIFPALATAFSNPGVGFDVWTMLALIHENSQKYTGIDTFGLVIEAVRFYDFVAVKPHADIDVSDKPAEKFSFNAQMLINAMKQNRESTRKVKDLGIKPKESTALPFSNMLSVDSADIEDYLDAHGNA